MKNGIRTYVCVGCGESVTKSCTKNIKYCTSKCYHKHGKTGRKKTGKNLNCVVCDVVFYVPNCRIDTCITCSTECQSKWQSKKIANTCDTCGKTYELSPSRFKFDNPRFCSIKCRNENESVKAKLIEMNIDQQTKKMTSIEKIGYEVLRNANIDFEPQKLLFNKFCVDAYIPSAKTVIQFDGDYWHGNPAKFKELDARQTKRNNLDKSQDQYLNKCGIKVVRVWESDLRKNPTAFVSMI